MAYLKLIFKRAFRPTWTIVSVITSLFSLVASAIWGENQPLQYIAWGIIGAVIVIVVFRLFILVPYQIWAEDQEKIHALTRSDDKSLRTRKKWLLDASSGLLTSAKNIYNEWSVADEKRRNYLQSVYNDKRRRMTGLADGFVHHEDIFRAAQDAMNRCDILMSDAREGLTNRDNLTEAHEYARRLLTLLAPDSSS